MKRRRGKGEGTIHHREDLGCWTGQLSLGHDPETGKRRRVTVYGSSYKECRERLEEARQQAALPRTSQTVKTALPFWLGTMKVRVDPGTYVCYEWEAGPIKEFLGDIPLAELTPDDVQGMYRAMADRGDSADRQHRAGQRLRQFLSACVLKGVLAANPAARVPLPRVTREEVRPLTARQARQLLKTAEGDRYEAMYHLALDTGARQGELWALTWRDLRLGEAPEVVINKSLQGRDGTLRIKVPKTAKGRRRVPICPETAALLREQAPSDPDSTALVFTAQKGGYMRKSVFIRKHFKPLLVRAGLSEEGFTFHDLRHTCATLLLLANVHPKIVQERLGHSTIGITLDTYSHLLPTMQTSAVSALSGQLFAPAEGAENP